MSSIIRHFPKKDHVLFGGLFVFSGALAGSMIFRSAASGALSGAAVYLGDCFAVECGRKYGRLSTVSNLALGAITLLAGWIALEAAGVPAIVSPERIALFLMLKPLCTLMCLQIVEKCLVAKF